MNPAPYIAVAGPIGVGKSSLARAIHHAMGPDARWIPERFNNPFLPRLYEPGGLERWGLACEMAFLPERYDDTQLIAETLAAGTPVITDWVPWQNLAYASLTLGAEELAVYTACFTRLMQAAPLPSCLVILNADTAILQARTAQRGRSMESTIDPAYLDGLRGVYTAWAATPPVPCPTLVVDTTDLRESDVVQQVLAHLQLDAPRWFRHPAMQARLAEAERDFATGRVTAAATPAAAQAHLDSLKLTR